MSEIIATAFSSSGSATRDIPANAREAFDDICGIAPHHRRIGSAFLILHTERGSIRIFTKKDAPGKIFIELPD